MIRTASIVALVLVASSGSVAWAQSSAPQAYTLKADGTRGDIKTTVTIVRDGARERVERTLEVPNRKVTMTTLYDFGARRVYWIGWSGAGSCSSGRYLSARAPVDEDPVTGTADQLAKLTKGRSRKAAGTGAVGGRPARIEAFAGGKRPANPDEPWPARAWLAEDGGYLLKLEGDGPKGKPVTLLEVTQLTFGKPAGAQLQPPSECTATDSEMGDDGTLRAHGEGTAEVKASATADLGTGTTSATVTQTGGTASKPGQLAKLGAVKVSAVEQPHEGKCGSKLQLTGTVAVDGPATVQYRFYASVGGLMFADKDRGEVTVDAAGSAMLVKDATFLRPLKGQLRLQAMVLGTKGHNGPMKTSDPVPFQVTCAGK